METEYIFTLLFFTFFVMTIIQLRKETSTKKAIITALVSIVLGLIVSPIIIILFIPAEPYIQGELAGKYSSFFMFLIAKIYTIYSIRKAKGKGLSSVANKKK